MPVAVDPGLVFPLQSAKRLIPHISFFTFHLSLRPYPDISSSGVATAMKVSVKNVTDIATKYGFGAGFKPAQGVSGTNQVNFPPQGGFETRPYQTALRRYVGDVFHANRTSRNRLSGIASEAEQ